MQYDEEVKDEVDLLVVRVRYGMSHFLEMRRGIWVRVRYGMSHFLEMRRGICELAAFLESCWLSPALCHELDAWLPCWLSPAFCHELDELANEEVKVEVDLLMVLDLFAA